MARAKFLEKHNSFTSRDYRFIKFITRQLVRVTHPDTGKSFSFFYPYEVQILDYEHYVRSLSGPASHEEYKSRQRARARQRVFAERSTRAPSDSPRPSRSTRRRLFPDFRETLVSATRR